MTEEPRPPAHGVWIPLPLANALFECYYGTGPRSRGRTDAPPPLPPEQEGELPPAPPTPVPLEHRPPPVAINGPGPLWKPRGLHAPKSPPADTVSVPPPAEKP